MLDGAKSIHLLAHLLLISDILVLVAGIEMLVDHTSGDGALLLLGDAAATGLLVVIMPLIKDLRLPRLLLSSVHLCQVPLVHHL